MITYIKSERKKNPNLKTFFQIWQSTSHEKSEEEKKKQTTSIVLDDVKPDEFQHLDGF